MEAERGGLGGRRIGRIAPGAEGFRAFEKVNGDFGIRVAEGWSAGLEKLLGALVDPGEAFFAIACAEFSEKVAETAVERFLDAGHCSRFKLPRLAQGTRGKASVRKVYRWTGTEKTPAPLRASVLLHLNARGRNEPAVAHAKRARGVPRPFDRSRVIISRPRLMRGILQVRPRRTNPLHAR